MRALLELSTPSDCHFTSKQFWFLFFALLFLRWTLKTWVLKNTKIVLGNVFGYLREISLAFTSKHFDFFFPWTVSEFNCHNKQRNIRNCENNFLFFSISASTAPKTAENWESFSSNVTKKTAKLPGPHTIQKIFKLTTRRKQKKCFLNTSEYSLSREELPKYHERHWTNSCLSCDNVNNTTEWKQDVKCRYSLWRYKLEMSHRLHKTSRSFYSLLQKLHCTCAKDKTTCWNVRQLQKSWLEITRQLVRSFPEKDFLQQVHHLLDFKCVRIVNESSGEIFRLFLRRLLNFWCLKSLAHLKKSSRLG